MNRYIIANHKDKKDSSINGTGTICYSYEEKIQFSYDTYENENKF